MRILLTNDDGINSPYLLHFKEILEQKHELWIVAPQNERSASSHAITLNRPLKVKKLAERFFSLDGTPADCIILGLREIVEGEVDVVLSGINQGANLGTDIIYSGTVAAARQGALAGKPSFAISQVLKKNEIIDIKPNVPLIISIIEWLYSFTPENYFYNINLPTFLNKPVELDFTKLSRRQYNDRFEHIKTDETTFFYIFLADGSSAFLEPNTDFVAIEAGKISITCLSTLPVVSQEKPDLKNLFKPKEFFK